jgi:vacuolar protein-sorting-associated protein 4
MREGNTGLLPGYARARLHLARAIACDERRERDAAVQWYRLASEEFLRALRQDPAPESRRRVVHAVKGYVERAELLVGELQQRPVGALAQSPARASAAASAAAEDSRAAEAQQAVRAQQAGFRSVAGLAQVKTALREAVVLPMSHPEAFVGGRKPWKGVLLYGPPGTGKSHVAAALSREAGCAFVSVSASDLVSKHVGESEKAVRRLFESARAKRPCVIFIDEVDSIGRARDSGGGSGLGGGSGEASRRLLTELLKQMDGVGIDNEGVTVLAATNLPDEIDAALRRRFEKRIYVPMPGPRARRRVLRLCLGRDPEQVRLTERELTAAAERAAGYSGSDMAVVANEALMQPVRRCLAATHFEEVPRPSATPPSWLGWVMGQSGDHVLVPCEPHEAGAIRMSMLDPEFPAERLYVPPVTARELEAALRKTSPSVDPAALRQYADFAAAYGDRLAVQDFEDCHEDAAEEDAAEEAEAREAAALAKPAQAPAPAPAAAQQARQNSARSVASAEGRKLAPA